MGYRIIAKGESWEVREGMCGPAYHAGFKIHAGATGVSIWRHTESPERSRAQLTIDLRAVASAAAEAADILEKKQ
jgi:hypothetical protein